jgi:hypothetical protein
LIKKQLAKVPVGIAPVCGLSNILNLHILKNSSLFDYETNHFMKLQNAHAYNLFNLQRARKPGMLVISCSNRLSAKKYCWKAEQCMALHHERRIRRSFNNNIFHINFSYLALTLKYLNLSIVP